MQFAPILKKIKPTEEERAKEQKIVREVKTLLDGIIAKSGYKLQVMVVGSLAKGTDLRESKDIDFFMLYDTKIPRNELEKSALSIGKSFFKKCNEKFVVSYAEHPYVRGSYRNYDIEIVPCYRIRGKEGIMSAVDRSPLHTRYVKKILKNNSKLKDEILLLKQFMKANNIYGADAAVEGFSGYLCELLVLKYCSFENVLNGAKDWRAHEVLGIRNISKKIADRFKEAALVFIDPVDARRNVAAALSMQRMGEFVVLAKNFLSKPDASYFVEKTIRPMPKETFRKKLRKRGTHLMVLTTERPDIIDDTLVPQVRKTMHSIKRISNKYEFSLVSHDYAINNNYIYYILEFLTRELPLVQRKEGPSFSAKEADEAGFLKKNSKSALGKPRLEDGMWVAYVQRRVTDTDELVKAVLAEKISFGKNLRKSRFKIYRDSEIQRIKDNEFWKKMSVFW